MKTVQEQIASTVIAYYDKLIEQGYIKTHAADKAAKKNGITQRTVYNYLKQRK